jgi:hydroxymethylpyrimidine pyrophosphatase-like HAD family hydrolase
MSKADGHTSKIALVLADVDGTLVTADKVLTARAIAAVKDLEAAGIAFAITSGRPPRGMAMLFKPLMLRTPVAGFNGGIFVKPDMTVMEEHVLPPDVAKRSLDLILRNGIWMLGSIAATSGLFAILRRRMSPVSNGRSSLPRLSRHRHGQCESRGSGAG